MFTVVDIEQNEMTRTITLIDERTGKSLNCFDDSAVVSNNNFSFIEKGKSYECKIKLFGNVKKTTGCIICTIVEKGIFIGIKRLVMVVSENVYYYVPETKVTSYNEGDIFPFDCKRMDLIQVNEIIHGDLIG